MKLAITIIMALAAIFIMPALGDYTAEYWSNQGDQFFMNGSYELAAASYDKALELEPTHIVLLDNKGSALANLGRYEDALKEFRLALMARERDGRPRAIRIAFWMIAWTLRALGRLDEAVEIQLRLERECDESGEPDPYVFEELELLYRALKNEERAEYYASRRSANKP